MVGIDCKVVELPKTISQENFERTFAEVNDDPKVDGILLFRPLPEGLDEEPVKLMIHPGEGCGLHESVQQCESIFR